LIDHNQFLDAKRNVTNGGEPIQIGGNAFLNGQIAANTTVEYNLFERADGDFEIISVKSSGNTIRYNKFIECDGALWLRGG